MTFVLKSAAPDHSRNALEMLRHTGFGLQGCLLFCTQRGGVIGHPGLGVRRTGPDTDKARKPARTGSLVRTAADEGGSTLYES